jgi:glycosyltransferase involved in cell wall biosynthesis
MTGSDRAARREVARSPRALVAHPGAELYGSDRVMVDSVDALVRAGWSVTVALPEPGPLEARVRDVGARVVICPSPVLRKAALRPTGALRLLADTARGIGPGVRLMRDVRPDLVYVSTVTIPLWFLLARLFSRPAVCHVHEAETGAPSWVQTALVAPLLSCRRILANSEFSREVLVRALPRLGPRCVVFRNPVPGPAEVTPPRDALVGRIRVLYIGRISPRKGPHIALDAVAQLVAEGRDVDLEMMGSVFTGYEWFGAEIEASITRLGLADRARLSDFRADVWPVIAAADIVVVPSIADEPFGNTAVEAVLAARPVVASASGGLVEAVAGYDSALGVAPGDPSAIARAISRIVDDWPTFRDASLRDAEVAAERHSVDRYRERVMRELQSVATQNGSKAAVAS